MSDNVRKASEVILEIEGFVKEILSHVRHQDMAMKLLINRISVLEGVARGSQVFSAPPTLAPAATSQMPGLKPGVNLGPNVSKPRANQVFSASEELDQLPDNDEFGNEQIEIDLKPKGIRRGARVPPVPDKKSPVKQKVIYPNGKNICLANVEIFSLGPTGEHLIKKCRTNSAGKWSAPLSSGRYTVCVSKIGTSTKPNVDVTYEIDIPVSDKPLELQQYQVN